MADNRIARTADQMTGRQDARALELAERVRKFVLPSGDEPVPHHQLSDLSACQRQLAFFRLRPALQVPAPVSRNTRFQLSSS